MSIIQDTLQRLKAETGDNDIIFSFQNGECVFSNQYTHDNYFNIPIQNIEINFENFLPGANIIRVSSVVLFINREEVVDNDESNREFTNENETILYYSRKYGVDKSKISVEFTSSTALTEDRREDNLLIWSE